MLGKGRGGCAVAQILILIQIVLLDDVFSDFFELEESPVEGQSLQQKNKKRGKIEKTTLKPKDSHSVSAKEINIKTFDFCAFLSKNCPKTHC